MPNNGDVNPIPLLVIVAGSRAFLALMFTTITTISGDSTDLADWVFITFGTIPGAPDIANLILFLLLTLMPAVYGAMLIKRLLNPVAN